MPDICKYEGNRVLLVEGINDCHSILALCKGCRYFMTTL